MCPKCQSYWEKPLYERDSAEVWDNIFDRDAGLGQEIWKFLSNNCETMPGKWPYLGQQL